MGMGIPPLPEHITFTSWKGKLNAKLSSLRKLLFSTGNVKV